LDWTINIIKLFIQSINQNKNVVHKVACHTEQTGGFIFIVKAMKGMPGLVQT